MHWEITRTRGRREIGSKFEIELRGRRGTGDRLSYRVLGVTGDFYLQGGVSRRDLYQSQRLLTVE